MFDSTSSDLVSPNTPLERSLVYIRDLTTRTTRLLSVDAAGTGPANRSASRPVLSPDGTKVAFVSNATNLGPPTDGDNVNDVDVRDLVTNTTTLVSVNAAGTDGGVLESATPVFSPDGTRIAFRSRAFDLVPTDTNTTYDLFVRDLADDTNGVGDVFLRDLGTGALRRVSTASDGTAGNQPSTAPVLSPDGAHVVFESFATNLDAGVTDANDQIDLYVKDLATDETSLVSVDATGTSAGAGGESRAALFQPGTSNVAFTSRASNLAINDTNGLQDIFLRDLPDGVTSLVSYNATGDNGGNGTSSLPRFQPNGSKIAFVSFANNLVALDRDPDQDIFLASVVPSS